MKNQKIDHQLLKAQILDSMSLLLLREFIMKIFAIIGQFVLVRLLAPEFFGVFAILTFILSTGEIFTDIGFTQSIIQKKDNPTHKQLSTIFYLKMLLTLIIVGVIYIFSLYIITLFKQLSFEHVWMLRAFVFLSLLKPYKMMLTSLLERDLNYNVISKSDVIGILAYYVIGLTLAFKGFNVWSLIVAIGVKEIAELLVLYHSRKWVPLLYFNFSEIKKMVRFGLYLQVGTVMSYLHNSTIPFIGGIKSSPFAVGLLDVGSKMSMLPNILADNYGRIAFAGFSKIQDNINLLSKSIEKSILILNMINFLFIALMFGFAREIIYYMLTPKWLPALPAVYWFVASTFFYGATVSVTHALLAMGKSKQVFYISVVTIIIEWVLSLTLFSHVGFLSIAIGTFAGILTFFVQLIILAKLFKLDLNYLRMYFKTSLILIFTVLLILLIKNIFPNTQILLATNAFFSTVFYILLCILFYKKEVYNLASIVIKTFKIKYF